MSESVIICTATIEDSAAYEFFMADIFAENLDTLCPRVNTPSSEQVHSWLASHTGESSVALLAFRSNFLIGTASLSCFARPHLDHTAGLGLNVKASERGKSIGRSLLREAIEWFHNAKHIERIELEVTSNNASAIHLYEAFGFSLEGVKRGAVKKGNRYLDLHTMGLRKNG